MKAQRTLTIILAVLAVLFAFLWFSGARKQTAGRPEELWRTNTVQLWFTNSIDRWHTNTLSVERTNIVVQTVTNEIIKEVPARLTLQEKQAGATGVKYFNAPTLAEGSSVFYKAGPLAVAAHIDASATKMLPDGPDGIRRALEAALASRNIPVVTNSPLEFRLSIAESWTTDVPRVAVLSLRFELREPVSLQRQGDVVKHSALVWSTNSIRLVRTVNASEDVKKLVEEMVAGFCDDYIKAKAAEKEVEARLPAVPPVFL